MKFVEMAPVNCRWRCCWRPIPEQRIAAYLPGAWGFAALAGNEVVAPVAGLVGSKRPRSLYRRYLHRQQQGIGSGLLRFVLTSLAGKGYSASNSVPAASATSSPIASATAHRVHGS